MKGNQLKCNQSTELSQIIIIIIIICYVFIVYCRPWCWLCYQSGFLHYNSILEKMIPEQPYSRCSVAESQAASLHQAPKAPEITALL